MDQKRIFGLIGKNISYSFSRNYFSDKFSAAGLNCDYLNFDIDSISQFPDILKSRDISGLNVTIPFKQQILPFLDDVSNDAKIIGAVNTISIKDGKLTGHNTDWIGFQQSVAPLLRPHHKKALILGTGGASKAVAYAFDKLGISYLLVSSSKVESAITYGKIDARLLDEYKIIVNCTPVGTFPDVGLAPDLPYEFLNESHLLYDLIYNPKETLFLKSGKVAGAQTKNGYEMLILQAEAAWRIWNGQHQL